MKRILGMLLFLMNVVPNNDYLHLQDTQLIIQVDENFKGSLYHDDALLMEIHQLEDSTFEVVPGIYTLFDHEGKMIDREVVEDEHFHFAFDKPICKQLNNHYLFQTYPKVTIYDPNKEHLLELEKSIFELDGNTYYLYEDHQAPEIKIDLVTLEDHIYITNKKEMILSYKDECPEMFQMYDDETITIPLAEGINDLSSYLKDNANNQSLPFLWVVCDLISPKLSETKETYYLQKEKVIEIDENYLDTRQSYYEFKHQRYAIKNKEIPLNETGEYYVYLIDKAGNTTTHTYHVIMDTIAPIYTYELKENHFSFKANEPLLSQSLKLNDIVLEGNDYEFLEEGIYTLSGEIVDVAGNKTEVKETIVVDLNAPKMNIHLNQVVYLEPIELMVDGSDTFNMQWHIEIYRNKKLFFEKTGEGNFEEKIPLSEKEFDEGKGEYQIKLQASDGLHQSQLEKTCVIDMKCAPLKMLINGYEANSVSSLLLHQDALFELSCLEGTISYALYHQDGTVFKDQVSRLVVSSNDNYEKIVWQVEDEHGYRNTKEISFTYPEVLEILPLEKTIEERPKEMVEEKAIIEEEIVVSKPKPQNEKPQTTTSYEWTYIVGGVIFALIVLRFFVFRKLRHQSTPTDLFSEQTVSLRDIEETRVISNQEN